MGSSFSVRFAWSGQWFAEGVGAVNAIAPMNAPGGPGRSRPAQVRPGTLTQTRASRVKRSATIRTAIKIPLLSTVQRLGKNK